MLIISQKDWWRRIYQLKIIMVQNAQICDWVDLSNTEFTLEIFEQNLVQIMQIVLVYFKPAELLNSLGTNWNQV